MSLEDYILQVVSSEASVEDEPEALKALAVAARTYALKNTGVIKNKATTSAAQHTANASNQSKLDAPLLPR